MKPLSNLLATSLLLACGQGEPSSDDVAAKSGAIINGTPVTDAQNPGVVAVYAGGFCSGTLIRRQWVLTARHCMTTDGEPGGPLGSTAGVGVVRAANPGLNPPLASIFAVEDLVADSGVDLALLRLAMPIEGPMPLSNATSLAGASLQAYGFGLNTQTTGVGTLRVGSLTVSSAVGPSLIVNSAGHITWQGDSGGPSFRPTDMLGRLQQNVASVHSTSDGISSGVDISVPAKRSWIKRRQIVPGDIDGDRRADIALTGGVNWSSLPVAFSQGNGTFSVTNLPVSGFSGLARVSGARAVSGDFDGDGKSDLALVGGAGWTNIPVARSNGDGTFAVTLATNATFATLAATAGVKAIPGDFNGDGRTDIALTGASGWTSTPIAFSNGDGTFTVTNLPHPTFPGLGATAGVKVLAGDFDGDGRDDIALTGVSGWTNLPVAFSNGNGTFSTAQMMNPTLAALASTTGAVAVTGDFNSDGRDDIALTGGTGWTSLPLATSNGNGVFTTTMTPLSSFLALSRVAGAKPVVGDFNGDLFDDIALTGPSGWTVIPVLFGTRTGSFTQTIASAATFASLAATSGAVPCTGFKPL